MPAFLRCEECSNLFSSQTPDKQVECPHCGTVAVVGDAIASLPTPQLPGQESPPDRAYEKEAIEEQDDPFCQPGPLGRVLQKSTPWTIAVFANLAVMLVLMFISILVGGSQTGAAIIVPNSNLADNPSGKIVLNDEKIPEDPVDPQPRDTPRFGERSPVVNQLLDREKTDLIGIGMSGQQNGTPDGFGNGSLGKGERGFLDTDGGNAHHVVYLIDRSGSMGQGRKMLLLRQQLLLSIDRLDELQDFHVIMFSGERGEAPKEKSPRHLTPASEEFGLKAAEFLEDIGAAEGNTVAAPALRRAFAVLAKADTERQGKLIYFLTDGQLSDREEVFKVVEELNQTNSVQINTLLLSEDEDSGAAQTLRRIATQTGGEYKHVSPDEAH